MFAGSGSPYNDKCKGGFDLVESGARQYGYQETEIVSWPGQDKDSSSYSGELAFDGACQVARSHLDEWRSCGEQFTLLARSFGTLVAAKVLSESGVDGIDRVVLWGPPPYPVMWSIFHRDFADTKSKYVAKGTLLHDNFFQFLEPFEAYFLDIPGKVIVVFGSTDKHVPPTFRRYLESLTEEASRYEFREVRDAPHECDYSCPQQVQEEYLHALFSE